MKNNNYHFSDFKLIGSNLLLILSILLFLAIYPICLAQPKNEKTKITELTSKDKMKAMELWQKENFECMVDFGNNILNSIAPQGVVFVYGAEPTYSLYYLLKKKNLRPDIEVYDSDGTFFKSVIEKNNIYDLEKRKKAERDYIRNAKRPIYCMVRRNMDDLPEFTLHPCGMVFQVVREHANPSNYGDILSKMINLDDYLWKVPKVSTRGMVSNYHYMMGINYLAMNDTKKASIELNRASLVGFDIHDLHTNLGSYYGGYSMIEEAIYEYLHVIQMQPKDQPMYFWLAYAYSQKGDNTKAIAICRKGIEINPKNPVPHFSFAAFLEKIGKDRDAIQEIKSGLALDSTDGEAYYHLGLLLEKNKNYKEAIPYYEKSINYLNNLKDKQDAKTRLQKIKNRK